MRTYRKYRGLRGETIRVPEDTIVPMLRIHHREPFPFVAIAQRVGDDRNGFARRCLRNPLI